MKRTVERLLLLVAALTVLVGLVYPAAVFIYHAREAFLKVNGL